MLSKCKFHFFFRISNIQLDDKNHAKLGYRHFWNFDRAYLGEIKNDGVHAVNEDEGSDSRPGFVCVESIVTYTRQ